MIEQYLNKMSYMPSSGDVIGGTSSEPISIANLYTNTAAGAGPGITSSSTSAALAAALNAANSTVGGGGGLGHTTSNYRLSSSLAQPGGGGGLSSLAAQTLPSGAAAFGLSSLPITSTATGNLLLDDLVDGMKANQGRRRFFHDFAVEEQKLLLQDPTSAFPPIFSFPFLPFEL